jgi:hypothetical protein
VFSLALLPFFVWVTRRVGAERKRITTERSGRQADMSTLVEESLSVSGVLLGKTMGRSAELALVVGAELGRGGRRAHEQRDDRCECDPDPHRR